VSDPTSPFRLASITLDAGEAPQQSAEIEQERNIAIFDLLEANAFALCDGATGPYALRLSVQERMLIFDVTPEQSAPLRYALPFSAFRKRARSYFELCDTYFEAVRLRSHDEIAQLDEERKALHNEGAEAVRGRLSDWAEIDHDTARRLFTLICSLVYRG